LQGKQQPYTLVKLIGYFNVSRKLTG